MPIRLRARAAALMTASAWLVAGPAPAAELTNLPPVLPPLDFLANKPPLPDLLLKDKRVGRYVTGFPAIGVDPETGLNYGLALQWFDNGPADSPFFRYTPYRQRIAIAAASSTGGSTRGLVGYDVPYIGESPWRIRTAALFALNEFENYFGIGESTLGHLTYPGSTERYDRFDDYRRALERVVDGDTWARYNDYRRKEARGVLTVERDYWGGRLRPQLGIQIAYVDLEDYTGDNVEGGVMQETRLRHDHQAGAILGFGGGWDNAFKIGLTYDSRDFEPDPAAGVMLQAVARLSTDWFGSDFDYQQITLNARGYYNLLGDPSRLVLAGRLNYVMQFGDVPFYSSPTIPLTDGDIQGLGGHATLRGFVSQRFVGEAAAFATAELRWTLGEKTLWKQHLRFMLVPFVDTGRVFDSAGDTTFKDWKVSGGAGFRLAWNLSTIVSFDYACSSEGNLFYMELGHQF